MNLPTCPRKAACLSFTTLIAVAAFAAGPAMAQSPPGYGKTLSAVYNAHQRLIAIKEACSESRKETAAANDKAYTAWRLRYKALIDEIEARFDALIRGASTDDRDYSRNYGKYHGAVVAQRQEYREAFLAQPQDDVDRLCREFPGYLKGPDADLGKAYADELNRLRAQRPMATPSGKVIK